MSTHHGLYQMFLKFEIFVYRYCQLIPFHHSSSDFNISPQCGFPLLSQQRESFLKYLLCVFKKKSIIWCQSKNCVYSVNSKVSTESTEYVLSKFLATWYCCNSGVVWKFWSAKALGDSENQMYWYTTLWECMLSHVWLFVTPWTVACQTLLSLEILQARILESAATYQAVNSVFYILITQGLVWHSISRKFKLRLNG